MLALAGLLLAAPTAAFAQASDHLAVSQDGHTWSASLDGSVLDDAPQRWAPGDQATGDFWVRNDGPSPASLSVGLEPADDSAPASALLDDLSFHATVDSTSRDLARDQEATALAVLRPGESTKVSLAVGFDPESLNASQSEAAPIKIRVRLTDTAGAMAEAPVSGGAAAGSSGATTGSGGASTEGQLPATGSRVDAWMTWVAFAAIGVGSVLLAGASGRRRRRS